MASITQARPACTLARARGNGAPPLPPQAQHHLRSVIPTMHPHGKSNYALDWPGNPPVLPLVDGLG
eukprot:476175-Lingulodinium_polyedra.AAC.1